MMVSLAVDVNVIFVKTNAASLLWFLVVQAILYTAGKMYSFVFEPSTAGQQNA